VGFKEEIDKNVKIVGETHKLVLIEDVRIMIIVRITSTRSCNNYSAQ